MKNQSHCIAASTYILMLLLALYCTYCAPTTFLATLVALHFTPVSKWVSGWAEFRTSVASRLASLLFWIFIFIYSFGFLFWILLCSGGGHEFELQISQRLLGFWILRFIILHFGFQILHFGSYFVEGVVMSSSFKYRSVYRDLKGNQMRSWGRR